MPPQTNATVTAVAQAGTADDWDRPGNAGAAKWAGEVRAYYREATERQDDAATANVLVRRELIVDTADLDDLDLDTDDPLTFTVDGAGASSSGVARAIRRSQLAGVPRALQTSLITLEDA